MLWLLVHLALSRVVQAFLPSAGVAHYLSIQRPSVDIVVNGAKKFSATLLHQQSISHITEHSPKPDPSAFSAGGAPRTASSTKRSKKETIIRPLTQNWWPVSLTATLDRSKPNPIDLLNKKLVLWYDDNSVEEGGGWSCLDDRCAHRFAPLSEGRIVANATASGSSCLQCAYHGWEFNDGGGCNRIPQASDDRAKSNKLCAVKSYPAQECSGMIWVWADPDIQPDDTGHDEPISYASNLLQRFDKVGGTARAFQRDLPYGMEFLGENLADISHLPFSHHSVGTLNRGDGRPVPLEMLSEAEKIQTAELQNNPQDASLPLYQARVQNAAEHDPEIVAALKYNPAVQSVADPNLATSTLGFYDPCHIRYHRNQGIPGSSYEINLFMCPTTEGNSRVFLFTPFEKMLPKEPSAKDRNDDNAGAKGASITQERIEKKQRFKLFGRKQAVPIFEPHMGHMISHRIFDGDGVFLNKQGDRMRRGGLTPRDYNTPTPADIMANAFRRWLEKAAAVTRAAGEEEAADAAAGDNNAIYKDDRPRSELLDRYASHTANCSICQAALKELNAKRNRLSVLSKALIGATGASGVLLTCTAIATLAVRVLARDLALTRIVLRTSLSVLTTSALTLFASLKWTQKTTQQKAQLDKEIQKFYFEDYVHAEKD